MSLNMGNMEINTDASWRNVLLTICVASAAIYFFFFSHNQQSSSNSTSHSSSSTLDKDERQKRRERLAAIAEDRRIAILKRDDNVQDKANTDTSAVDTVSKSVKSQHTKQKSDANDVVASDKVKSKQKEKREEINTKKVDDSNNENSRQVAEQVAVDRSSSHNNVACASSKNTDGKEEMSVEKEELDDKESSSISNKSTENNGDESVDVIVKEESRQRTQQAIAKLKASKKEHTKKKVIEEEDSSSIQLTIYLILTSCPGSSRLELTIPNNISTTTLLQHVSQTSRIAITDMKLIFRGRFINNTTKTVQGKKVNAVDEYGIVEGCALHVMGKPTLPEVPEVAADDGGGIVETDPGEVDDEADDVEPNTYEDYEWDKLPCMCEWQQLC